MDRHEADSTVIERDNCARYSYSKGRVTHRLSEEMDRSAADNTMIAWDNSDVHSPSSGRITHRYENRRVGIHSGQHSDSWTILVGTHQAAHSTLLGPTSKIRALFSKCAVYRKLKM